MNLLMRFALIACAAVAVLTTACDDDSSQGAGATPTAAATSTSALPATFRETSCDFELPQGQQPQNVRCGTLAVPEDRSDPDGRQVELAVAVLKATSASPAPDPVLYLSGGPGGASLEGEMQSWTAEFAAPIQSKRDIVFYDQRGTGRSKPGLYCPEVRQDFVARLAEDLKAVDEESRARTAALACHERLKAEAANFGAYNSAASAEDIRDLRVALGYDEWNLYGVSYGTRLALTALRDQPEGIRSVVLDSTVPLDADIDAEQPANFEQVLELMFRDCAADTECNAAYPDLRETVYGLASQLNETPVTVRPTADDGTTFTVVVNGDRLILGAFQLFYATNLIPVVPSAAYQIADGNLGLLTSLAGAISSIGSTDADGMTFSVNCSEDVLFITDDDVTTANDGVNERLVTSGLGTASVADLNQEHAFCDAWGAPRLAAYEDEPVSSDVPALVLAGEYDPITPPRYGRHAAETLSRSRFFEFPGTGHGAIYGRHDCAASIVAAWLDAPDVEPDAGCIDTIGAPAFQLP
jgi:pimeloyl-ACP methyl ester carboxylesterase